MARKRIVDDPEKRRWVKEWDESGLSAARFAARVGMQETTLRAWARAIRGPLERRSRGRPVARSVELVEAQALAAVAGVSVELGLKNGRRLLLCGEWTATRIAELAAALESV